MFAGWEPRRNTVGRVERPEIASRRTTFERIFAPFEAPQQFLYRFTTGIAEDGFQFGDILDATLHGARYFNPFSNEQRIDEDEIRQIFFGEDSPTAKPNFGTTVTNLGIALLYDPLFFALGPAKAGAKALGMSQRAVTVIDRVINPAGFLFDATKAGGRGAANLTRRGLEAAVGSTRAEIIGTKLQNNLISRFAGIPQEAQDAIRMLEARKRDWRNRGANVIKSAQELGGRQGQELLAEALELDAVFFARRGDDLNDAQKAAFAAFDTKLGAAGIDKDSFFSVYEAYRGLDDEIGSALVDLGVISGREFAEYEGTHLRRVFQAFETPAEYIGKIEALEGVIPDMVRTDTAKLAESLRAFPGDLRKLADIPGASGTPRLFGAPTAADIAGQAGGNIRKYFDKAGDFEVDRFVSDFDQLVRTHSTESAGEIMARVKRDMLGISRVTDDAIDIGRADQKLYTSLLNYMTGSLDEVKGATHYADMLRQRMAGPPMVWRSLQENMKLVSERGFIPEEIREALGEVTTAAPRLAREVGDVTDLLEFRRFADELTGTSRWTAEEIADLKKLREEFKAAGRSSDELAAAAKERFGVDLAPNQWGNIAEGKIKTQLGTTSASRSAGQVPGASIQLSTDPRLGSLSGAYAKPAIARYVDNVMGRNPEGAMTVSQRMMYKMGELLRTGTSYFKLAKVVMDPTAQARNFIGNAVLADWAGVNVFTPDLLRKTVSTIRDYAAGNLNQYSRLAVESGYDLLGTTFSKTELRQLGDALAGMDLTKVGESSTSILGKLFEGVQKIAGGYTKTAGNLFSFNEELFKMSVFINRYEDLAKPLVRRGTLITKEKEVQLAKQAAQLAEQALFNYADIPYLAQYARDYGAVPFVTFPIKAASFTAKTLEDKPWRALKYHRTAREWNDMQSGGPDQTAREIAALPKYVRDSLVIRLPFEDADGRAQYIDMSYFMPYTVIKDLYDTVGQIASPLGIGETPPEQVTSGMGLREGYFSPPVLGLLDAIRHNQDSLGRPIFKPEYDTGQKLLALGNYVAEFVLPPSFPGGSRAETIGRALQAMSRTSPEPLPWAEFLAVGLRGLGPEMNNVFTYPGERPQTGAAVGGSQIGQFLGMSPDNPVSMLIGAGFETGFLGGATASDPGIASAQVRTSMNFSATEIARQMAQIRSDSDLSREEKTRRLLRLERIKIEAAKSGSRALRAMR